VATKVCAVAAQPGHTKDLQSIQLERGLRIVDSPGVIFDLSFLEHQFTVLPPISGYGDHFRHNFDGYVVYSVLQAENKTAGYVQAFRNGCIEAADALLLSNHKYIPSVSFEDKVAKALRAYLRLVQRLDIQPPVYVALSLLRVAGYYMAVGNDFDPFDRKYIDRSELLLPEIAVEDLSKDPYIVLRPSFDMVWNAAGWPRSMNYYDDGSRKV